MEHKEETNRGEKEEVAPGGQGGQEGQGGLEEESKQGPVEKRGGENRDKPSQKELRKLKEERRELWRIKRAKRDKNKKSRERKKKEQEEEMIRKGKMKTMSQYTLRGWAIGGLGLEGGHDGVQEGRIQRYNAL